MRTSTRWTLAVLRASSATAASDYNGQKPPQHSTLRNLITESGRISAFGALVVMQRAHVLLLRFLRMLPGPVNESQR